MANYSQYKSWPPPALDPAGPFAAPLSEISWVMMTVGGVVLLIVLAALGVALGNTKWKRYVADHKMIIGAGLAFPVVVLTASLIYGLSTTARLTNEPAPGELRIRVIGEMWWWRVIYLDGERTLFETANEIRIPAGRPVTLELQSADVIHSFWLPRLAAKLDMIPGRTNILRLQADAPGAHRGQCTEFCGAGHALMAFELIALNESDYETWRAAQMQPAAATSPELARGRELFSAAGCGACHQINGAEVNGRLGPNLTHFASRRTLGAGILVNDAPTLRRWIANADALKPAARMPAYDRLTEQELEAIAAYVESLQ